MGGKPCLQTIITWLKLGTNRLDILFTNNKSYG